MLKLPDCTSTKLRQLARVVSRHYDAELGKAGLTTSQFRLLSEIQAHGPIRPGDLAEAMALDPSTLTRNLKPLLAKSWVGLGPGSDGRTRNISISLSGRERRAEGLRHWTAAQASLHGLLGDRVVTQLHELLGECLALV
ncbi:DNA-binding transcriptional repressor MarR [compost metagenome]